MPYFLASSGLISTRGAGQSSRHQGSCRCSEWKYTGMRRPVVMISGYSANISGSDTGLCGGSV